MVIKYSQSMLLSILIVTSALVIPLIASHLPFIPTSAQLAIAPWPKFGRDPQNTGRSPYAGWGENTLSWFYPVGGWINESPVVGADGTVYFGAADNKFYAVSSGRQKWSYPTGGRISGSPAIGSDGTIYFGAEDGKLYALNPDGTLKWTYDTYQTVGSPTIGLDNTIYFGAGTVLYAINPDNSLKWSQDLGDVFGSPAIGLDNVIYVGTGSSGLYAINPDGTLRWTYPLGRIMFFYSSPAIGADGTIYIGSEDSKLYAINPDGTLKWTYTTGDQIHSSPAIGPDGTIYIPSRDCRLYAINPDGTKKWEYALDKHTYGSPSIDSNGVIYIGDHGGRFYAINSDGTIKWKYFTWGTINTRPAIAADGTIYFGTWDPDRKLYAIGPTIGIPMPQLTITSAVPTLQPGQSITLTGTLTSNGNPLGGKLIEWSALYGTISPAVSVTDSQGKVEVAYIAPDSGSEIWVARGRPPEDFIVASFAGDNQYLAASGTLSLVIESAGIPPLWVIVVAALALVGVLIAVIWKYLSCGAAETSKG